jgi:hypothetical protein
MKKLKLYRGITLNENNVNRVVTFIKENGLNIVEESQWSGFIWKDLRGELKRLFEKENLDRDETQPNSIWVENEKSGHREYIEGNVGICFADRIGANYYAFKHNMNQENKIPVVITVEVDIKDVAIDGRDFLYTVFGFLDRENIEKTKRQKATLSKLYGDKIGLYVDKVINNPESDKFAVCDLAIIDDDIITSHLANKILIKGRHRTIFKSAFYVKVPIQPSSIKKIQINKPYDENSEEFISLDEILER